MKPFYLKQIIKERVNREAEFEHANDPRPTPPKYTKSKVVEGKPGWYVFFRQLLP